MRTAYGPLVVLVGLAMTVVLVLLLFSSLGMRSELERARGELDSLADVLAQDDPGITDREMVDRLDELDAAIDDLLLRGTGAPGASSGAGGGAGDPVADRLDEILGRIEALDDRIDEICRNVPVC